MPDALIAASAPMLLLAWTDEGFRDGPVSLWIYEGGGIYRDDANLSRATLAELRRAYGEQRVRAVKFCGDE